MTDEDVNSSASLQVHSVGEAADDSEISVQMHANVENLSVHARTVSYHVLLCICVLEPVLWAQLQNFSRDRSYSSAACTPSASAPDSDRTVNWSALHAKRCFR